MAAIIALALKDLRLLTRVRAAFFFTFIWPLIVAVLFGFAFGGPSEGGSTAIRVAVVDEDNTDGSRAFIERLGSSGEFELTPMTRTDAESTVRRGQRAAFLALKPGFGAGSNRLFYGAPRQIEVGNDPSRKAESGMIEGLLMKTAAEDMQRTMGDSAASVAMVDKALADLQSAPGATGSTTERFLTELKAFVGSPEAQASAAATTGPGGGWQPLKVTSAAIARDRRGPANPFEVTFPQGIIWGLIGCAMSFGLSLVTERTHGTFVRLQMAPLSRAQILGGKAVACFFSMLVVEVLLLTLGYVVFEMRPSSWPLLVVACLSANAAFVGFMMLVATLGKTEQSASGAAWAIMMPLSMVGGGMIPQFVMPAWMLSIGNVSPVKWTIRAFEGALWRQFSPAEMMLPCGILVAVGAVCFVIGTRRLGQE